MNKNKSGFDLSELIDQKQNEYQGKQIQGDNIIILKQEIKRLKDKIQQLENEKKDVRKELADQFFNSSIEMLEDENYIDAMGFLQAVLLLRPEDQKVKNNLAIVYYELGYQERAKKVLLELLEKDPENQMIKENLEIIMSEE